MAWLHRAYCFCCRLNLGVKTLYFLTSSQLVGDKLTVSVTVPEANQYTQYAYYLYRGSSIAQKQLYINHSEFTFVLSEEGMYSVKVFVQTKASPSAPYEKHTQITRLHRYCTEAMYAEYRAFASTPAPAGMEALPYQKYEYPYQDLLLVYDKSEQTGQTQAGIAGMADELGLLHTPLNGQALVVSQQPVLRGQGGAAAFSGMGRTNSRLIVGMSDIDSLACADEISGQVGSYCLLRADASQIQFETDYFGTDKLYYLHAGPVFLASNRVHLLVLAMQALHISRVPNMVKIHAYLAHSSYARQNFSQELNIQDMIALRSDSRLRIDLNSGEAAVEKTALFDALNASIPYDEARYTQLLAQACEEIVDNLKIALEHPAFEHYVMHITGGMDSRLVYCASTRLPQYRDKIIVKTTRKKETIEDYLCALKIISKHRYPLGKIPFDTSYRTEYTDGHLRGLSTVLGVTTEYTSPTARRFPYDKTCVLPGFYGEFLGRQPYSKGLHKVEKGPSALSDADFFSSLTYSQCMNAIFDAQDELNETMIKECLALPGRGNLEKLDCHYLFYRNGLHFTSAHQFRPIAPSWGVLQSKTQLALRCMIAPLHWGVKLQMDMIRYLNPELAAVTYESEYYQEQRKQLNGTLGGYPECMEYDKALIADIEQEWETNAQYERTMVENDFPEQEDIFEMSKVLPVFRILLERLPIREDAACAMYHYIKNGKKNSIYTRFLGKLYSLYYELF